MRSTAPSIPRHSIFTPPASKPIKSFRPRRHHAARRHFLFLFVGADPATKWLDGCGVRVDRAGFVLTGVQNGQNAEHPVSPLETTVPGVFAVGDVRSGSVKRVGGAIGEGAQVVAALHGYLGDAAKPAL